MHPKQHAGAANPPMCPCGSAAGEGTGSVFLCLFLGCSGPGHLPPQAHPEPPWASYRPGQPLGGRPSGDTLPCLHGANRYGVCGLVLTLWVVARLLSKCRQVGGRLQTPMCIRPSACPRPGQGISEQRELSLPSRPQRETQRQAHGCFSAQRPQRRPCRAGQGTGPPGAQPAACPGQVFLQRQLQVWPAGAKAIACRSPSTAG